MRLLVAISIASFFTMLFLTLALGRRIRRNRKAKTKPAVRQPAMEFFEAGEFRTPRALWLTQKIAHPGASNSRDDVAAPPNLAQPEVRRAEANAVRGLRSSPPVPRPSAANLFPLSEVPRQTPRQAPLDVGSEAVIVGSRLQFVTADASRQMETAERESLPRDLAGERKPPQRARAGTFRRVDLSHYNKDLGDLTDPYTHSVRGSETPPGAAQNG